MIEGLEPWAQDALRAGTGLAIGALVGLERGFKLRDQREGHRVAGVRTFTLMGLAAGMAGLQSSNQPLAAAYTLWPLAIVIVYLVTMRKLGAFESL